MLCGDGDPRNEQIINILLNNGQVTKKQLLIHKAFHDKVGTEYEYMYDKNTANIRCLNDMNKTALYYASQKRKKDFGWNAEIGNVVNYDMITKGDNRTKKDQEMKRL